MTHFYDILKEHGLSKTLPIHVKLNPIRFVNFDWHPVAYGGPTVWYFTWNDITCSITSDTRLYQTSIYIRVHDLTPELGEKILDEITIELLKCYVPISHHQIIFYIYLRLLKYLLHMPNSSLCGNNIVKNFIGTLILFI